MFRTALAVAILCPTIARAQANAPIKSELGVYEITHAGATGKQDRRTEAAKQQIEKIARLVRELIPLGPGDQIRAVGADHLVALAPKKTLAKLEELVHRNEKARKNGERVFLSVRWLSIPAKKHAEHVAPLFKGRPSADAAKPVVMDKDTFETLIGSAHARTLRSASALLDPLRVVAAEATTKIAYVKDFEVELATEAAIADPAIDTIKEGLAIEAVTALRSDDWIALAFEARLATLAKPIKTKKLEVLGQNATIQLPEVAAKQLAATFVIPSGGVALFDLGAMKPGDDEGAAQLVVLTAERVRQ